MVDAWRHFFELNVVLVYFVYGQVFFVLGLAIALQSRRHSRLELARSLGWLSAFGLAHGLHEWGDVFIPVQAEFVSATWLTFLHILHLVLLALSFAFLFQFGVELLRDRWPWLAWMPLALGVGWGVWFIALLLTAEFHLWHQQANVLARYFLGFPGSLLAAYGLRYQAERQIKPLNLSRIYGTLRVAGLALGAYAVLGGLIGPAADFFPANWLNGERLVALLGVPPPVFRSLTGLIMAVAIIRALEVFDVEVDQLIEQMEIEQSLTAERERIGRELHDGAIQQVYTAGLIVEAALKKVDQESVARPRLERAITVLNEAIVSLRSYMGELRPGPTSISLAEGLRRQAADPRFETLMEVDLKLDLPETTSLNPIQTTHILAIVGEALSNTARHGQARRVQVLATKEDGRLVLKIEDDGRGFSSEPGGGGYGLRNMRDRARLLGGRLTIETEQGRGTSITLVAPWEEE